MKIMTIFSPHISFTELADLADEHSSPSSEALRHLAECSHCSFQLQTIRQTTSLMKSDLIENAPANLVSYAKGIFRQRVAHRKPSTLSRIVAALTFDSFNAAPAYGLRSQAGVGRQLVYSTKTVDIDVRVSVEDEEWQIAGQVPGLLCTSGEVTLESDSFSATAKLNELCEFSFSSVPEGTYRISVQLPDVTIETPPLEIGP
jgi:hypothetical protein